MYTIDVLLSSIDDSDLLYYKQIALDDSIAKNPIVRSIIENAYHNLLHDLAVCLEDK